MPLKNDEIEKLIKIEHLLWSQSKTLFGENLDKYVKYEAFGETDFIGYDDFMAFYNVVEDKIREKSRLSEKIADYHKKAGREKHNAYNREWARRKKMAQNA